jgi:hypothetical protein
MTCYASAGPLAGPLLARASYCGIGVYQSREDPTLIGTALAAGQREDGLALWRVTIGEIELPGLFVVIHRSFWPAG